MSRDPDNWIPLVIVIGLAVSCCAEKIFDGLAKVERAKHENAHQLQREDVPLRAEQKEVQKPSIPEEETRY